MPLLVDLAAVPNARDTDEHRPVVDDVHHAPVTDPDAPLILVSFEFPASCRPGIIGQRQNLLVAAGE